MYYDELDNYIDQLSREGRLSDFKNGDPIVTYTNADTKPEPYYGSCSLNFVVAIVTVCIIIVVLVPFYMILLR